MTEKQAIDLIKKRVDRVLDSYATREFVDCFCVVGGDQITYRVYYNGEICIK